MIHKKNLKQKISVFQTSRYGPTNKKTSIETDRKRYIQYLRETRQLLSDRFMDVHSTAYRSTDAHRNMSM